MDNDNQKPPVATISTSLQPRLLSVTSLTMDKQGKATVAIALARLAVHYYRPDFSEAQAKSLILDMVEDLSEFSVHEVEHAIKTYRQAPAAPGKGKYFPDSSALRQIIFERRSERGSSTIRPGREEFGESRPLMWWWKNQWQPHWREEEIPEGYRQSYYARKAKRASA